MSNKTTNNKLLSYCQKLVQTKSYSGQEGDVANLLIKEAINLGFDDAWIDEYGNAICRLRGTKYGTSRKILFDGHMDTVPVNIDKWSVDPFGGIIKDGKLYGRGASDMKCSLAAMLYAAGRLVEDKDQLCGEIYVSGTVNEEQFEGIALGAVLEAVKPDLVVIGEASEMSLKTGQRGRAEIVLEAFGKGAHSSNPQEGKNAVYTLSDYIQIMRDLPDPEDEFLGKGISVLTDITSKPYPGASVVPYYCVATLDRRLLCGESSKSVLQQYEKILDGLKFQQPDADMKISIASGCEKTYTGRQIEGYRFFPAWRLEQGGDLETMALDAMISAGLEAKISKYSFCTNGSMSAGERGIPTIGFGPGEESLAHIDDEYVKTEEILAACLVFSEISKRYLNQ